MAESPKKDVYLQLLNSLRTSAPPPTGWLELQLPAADRNDRATGFEAQAFVNDKTKQIVMAFNGPSSSPSGAIVGHGASTTDMLIARGKAPKAYDEKVELFVDAVKKTATANGYPTDASNIFATGSSLGGYGAQYASALSDNGFGGANFGGPGVHSIPVERRATPVNSFVNYLMYGDPVANLGTNTGIDFAGRPGVAPHYGTVEHFGNKNDHKTLQTAITFLTSRSIPAELQQGAWGALFGLTVKNHTFNAYVNGLGVNLTPPPPPPAPVPPFGIDDFFRASPYRLNWRPDKNDNGGITPDGKPAAFAPSGTRVDFGAIPLNGVKFARNGTSDAPTRELFPAATPPPQTTPTVGRGANAATTVSPYQDNQARTWRDTVVDSQNRPIQILDRVERNRVGNGQAQVQQVQEYARNGQPIGEPVRQGLGASGDRPGAEPLGEFSPPQPESYGDTPAGERASDPGQIREADTVHEDAESSRQDEAADRAAAYRQQAIAAHLARIDEAKQRIPDFDQVIRAGGRVPIAPGVADEILNSEKSALLQYHLAGNPGTLEELNGLSGKNLARAVGRLEGRLHLPPAGTITEASPPLSDVRDSAAPAFDPHTTDDMEAFANWLREDQARRRRA